MAKKQFKTKTKKLLDMMINSIYTHRDIFLRELISNASDAVDKRYFRSLTDDSIPLTREDYVIRLTPDKEARTLTVSDNGIGMTKEELESDLGTIARSGSGSFKADAQGDEAAEIDIIGQFGVGFYSAFMVADRITVDSRAQGADGAWRWESSGADGYTVEPCDKPDVGTAVTLHLKPDSEEASYSDYLEPYRLRALVKKYSDYIHTPIRMLVERQQPKADDPDVTETVKEDETLNSMVPLWKKPAADTTDEEIGAFYRDKFGDFEPPLRVIRQRTEGTAASYQAMLFIPAHAPYNYYSRDYEKGLQLYSSGVLIMDKCKELLPDHFSFVRGVVDSADLSLNVSRETLQQDRQLKVMATAIEKKVAAELKKMLEQEREKYEQFFKAFGTQLKWGVYSDFGTHREVLQDLLLFPSSLENKPVTLAEYVDRIKEDQKAIYYAPGATAEAAALLPQVEAVTSRGFEVLYLTEEVDEFALQMLHAYRDKPFANVCKDDLDIATEEEKEQIKQQNDDARDLLAFMKDSIGDAVKAVRFTGALKDHPACLSSEGDLSLGMEQTLNKMPGAGENRVKADLVLEINADHPIAARLKQLYADDRDKLAACAKVLYAAARMTGGLTPEDPAELSRLLCELMLG